MKQLKDHLTEQGFKWADVEEEIKDVIIKTIISVESTIVNQINNYCDYKNPCFELYGFDVFLDEDLKPWIIEVNVCPSLSSSSPFDKKIKSKLICDALTLIGIQPYDRDIMH